ncbi:unannotated protein [freshwater metagenome]|uniref:Unannotated protein n=1 Tax=freshwater metagenome TaxID=449393 RepID=A0A6J7DMZ0_9ZZZZ|nr:hypothetical protein [Actinomycetota bacterium]MUH58375.1 hypothetical protein [Actinomycetota bacterium]
MEIALGLSERGHEVALFALRLGEFANWVESTHNVACLTFDDLVRVRDKQPDRIVLMHWPTFFALQREGVTAPTVFGFLGRQPPLENPPPLVPGLSFPWFAVAESIEANINAISMWAESPHRIIRNWTGWAEHAVRTSAPLRRLAIVSNRMTAELEQQLAAAAHRAGIEVTRIGLPRNPQIVNEALLKEFDAIVSVGRSILDAMRLGRPALIYDIHGSDGWVTPETVERCAGESYSGREFAHRPSDDELDAWLAQPPSSDELRTLQSWVRENATLESALNQIEAMFEEATVATTMWGRFGEVPVEMMIELAQVRNDVAIRERQLELLTADRDNVVARIRSIESVITRVRPRFMSRALVAFARRRLEDPR